MLTYKKKSLASRTYTILVSPLDWGLGHATRCIPVIQRLMHHGLRVILGADGRAYDLLKREFPQLKVLPLPGAKIQYPGNSNLVAKIIRSAPSFYQSIKAENRHLSALIPEHDIRAVISDNRYGLYSQDIYSVFLGHQMMLRMPGLLGVSEYFVHKLHLYFMSGFHTCWIPDFPDPPYLSGDLAHRYRLPSNYHYVGSLSRFGDEPLLEPAVYQQTESEITPDILVILSGPEPQRSILEERLLSQLVGSPYTALIVRGVSESNRRKTVNSRITLLDYANRWVLQQLILKAKVIICRPGYSSIMDLAAAGKKAIFIPTPGQTEQEYLAWYHYQAGHYYYAPQKSFCLESAIRDSEGMNGLCRSPSYRLLDTQIEKLISQIEIRDQ